MKLDLTGYSLFHDDHLNLDKDINVIYGKNGTGKSTITNLIEEMGDSDVDVRVFQGFESVLGEDEKLNAVVLGEENKTINQQIKGKESKISDIELEIGKIRITISEPEDKKGLNLFTKHDKAIKEKGAKLKEIDKFYTDSAREISGDQQLVDNPRSYNKKSFETEIQKGKLLEKAEIEKLKGILKSEEKQAEDIFFPAIAFEDFLTSVNEIVNTKVEAKIAIEDLQNNSEKLEFARSGIDIHSEGDNCAFCGNQITNERLHTLKSYFSADEVNHLKTRIENGKQMIAEKIQTIKNLKVIEDNFYPDYIVSIKTIKKELDDLTSKQLDFLMELEKQLMEKEKYLFESQDSVVIEAPNDYSEISTKYKQVLKKNTEFAKNLIENQRAARQKLRFHEIKRIVDEFKLDVKLSEYKTAETIVGNIKNEIDEELAKIKQNENEIERIRKEIATLIKQTKNTRKLADQINDKLKFSVSFELIRKEENEQEYYEIKDTSGRIRSITELSTGEKNIIAFLYFMGKLNEVTDSTAKRDRIIVLDDPMNSNDDTMQYIIIDELQKLMKKCEKSNNSDKVIMLTHNIFFYLNSSYELKSRRDTKNPYDENNFYKLISDSESTRIIRIENKNQDFKTNYEALWHELVFLYKEDKPEMMLNPIRRIIETYTVFNGKEGFYNKNKDAKNLFNTNSHYFPDLNADLNGKTKEEIKELMKDCFRSNNDENHFTKHWKNASQG